jgi:hypothetical protein
MRPPSSASGVTAFEVIFRDGDLAQNVVIIFVGAPQNGMDRPCSRPEPFRE